MMNKLSPNLLMCDIMLLSKLSTYFMNRRLGQFTRNYTQTTKRGLLTTNKG